MTGRTRAHSGLLRITTVVSLTQAPAVGQDPVREPQVGMVRTREGAGRIDPADQWVAQHDMGARQRQTVLVAHCRPHDGDRDTAFPKSHCIKGLDGRGLFAVDSSGQQGFDIRELLLIASVRGQGLDILQPTR